MFSPMPRSDEILNRLCGRKYFSTLDLDRGYWQIRLDERSRDITTFSFASRQYKFHILPFGLSLGPFYFQRIIQNTLQDALRKYPEELFIFIDDILIASKLLKRHWEILSLVCKLLEENELRVNKSKCKICQDNVDYLGHTISPLGVGMQRKILEKVLAFELPKSKKQLSSFLGLANYVRKYVKDFGNLSNSLYLMLSSQKLDWGPVQLNNFQTLKKAIWSAPLLCSLDYEKVMDGSGPLFVSTDASSQALGGCLMQLVDKRYKIICFYSRVLRGSEVRYCSSELESLAIVSTMQALKQIIYGVPITVLSDHKPLCALLSKSDLSPRLLRWTLLLQEFKIKEIRYVEGKMNVIADALSRCILHNTKKLEKEKVEEFPTPQLLICNVTVEKDRHWTAFPTKEEWQQLQQEDAELSKVYVYVKENIMSSSDLGKFKDIQDYRLDNMDILIHKNGKILLPPSKLKFLLPLIHKNHESTDIMLDRIQRQFVCSGMSKIVQSFVANCL
uniref:Reverse transcriptase domain-containing protein n=1 Tax=Strongyloides stercoralis TaxID=6248 RepID=A0A0K0EAZ1_STRER